MIRVLLPLPLRTLARVDGEVELHVEEPVTQRSVLDALEELHPALRGMIRTHQTRERRPFVRFFACERDLSHEPADDPLPDAVVKGEEPFLIVGAIAGGREPTPSPPRSEAATLVCAVAFAVLLGVACGAWINARLASAASLASNVSVIPPARLLPAAPAGETPTSPANVAETGSETFQGTSETPSTRPNAPADRRRGRSAAVEPSESAFKAPQSARREISTPEVAKTQSKAVQGQERPGTCALYVSADALSLRGGGAAALFVGGPGEAGPVTVTTPDWANIAVFAEGRAGGSGWFRYSVRSVGGKAGVYSVRFTTRCGSRNIRVTVVRP